MFKHNVPAVFLAVIISGVAAQTPIPLSAADQNEIAQAHNYVRRRVVPTAANMEEMTYNAELAGVAQAYSLMCQFEHSNNDRSPSFSTIGENIYLGQGVAVNYTNFIVDSWSNSESVNYDFDSNTCRVPPCGHYTQNVWDNSANVGCGAIRCPSVNANGVIFTNAVLFICNYGPAGNFIGQRPYDRGVPCSSCPSSKPFCDANLCTERAPATTSPPTTPTTAAPTTLATEAPTTVQTEAPTTVQTEVPTTVQTEAPTTVQTEAPTTVQTEAPTTVQTEAPTTVQTEAPTTVQTEAPTTVQTEAPTTVQTEAPTTVQTEAPTTVQTEAPTTVQTEAPTTVQTEAPTTVQTEAPTTVQTEAPTTVQTEAPTTVQTEAPTTVQTEAPTTVQTDAPTTVQTEAPTTVQTEAPTTVRTQAPTTVQTDAPTTVQTDAPTTVQTEAPTTVQTEPPTTVQTEAPTTVQTEAPTTAETVVPTSPQVRPVNLINGSPRVEGRNVFLDVRTDHPLECAIRLAGMTSDLEDCSSNSFTFRNVTPDDNKFYVLRVVAMTDDGMRSVLRRRIWMPATHSMCTVHLINNGVTISENSATVEFDSTGPSNAFLCSLDFAALIPCSSPHTFPGLSAGRHRLKIVPDGCGNNRRPITTIFVV